LNIFYSGRNGEDNTSFMLSNATTESADRHSQPFIYNCSTRAKPSTASSSSKTSVMTSTTSSASTPSAKPSTSPKYCSSPTRKAFAPRNHSSRSEAPTNFLPSPGAG
jgi:hypothetical protein